MATRLDLARPGLAAAERLRRIATASEAGEPLDAGDAGWLAAGLNLYLEGAPDGLKLEEALEVAVPLGGVPWWTEQRRAERDAAIRELAATFAGPPWSRAQAVADGLRRYQTAGWRHDRTRGEPWPNDQRRRLMFAIFSADERPPPTGLRRIYDIIASP
jgi:hypothetical protein